MSKNIVYYLGILLICVWTCSCMQLYTTEQLEVEIYDWAFRLFVRKPVTDPETNQIIGYERLPDFNITMNSTFIGEGPEGSRAANFSIHDLPITYTNFTRPYPGANATVIQQKTTLPTGPDLYVEFEFTNTDTWKDYMGWHMPLPKNGIKISVRYSNVLGSTSRSIRDTMWYMAEIDTQMTWAETNSIRPFPINIDHSVFTVLADPENNPKPDSVQYTTLAWFEKRFNLSIEVLRDNIRCRKNISIPCKSGKISSLSFRSLNETFEQSAVSILNEMIHLLQTEGEVKKFILPIYIEMVGSGSYDSLEWDPNFNILFGSEPSVPAPVVATPFSPGDVTEPTAEVPQQEEGYNTNIAAIAVTCTIVVIIVIGFVILYNVRKLRERFLPTSLITKRRTYVDDPNSTTTAPTPPSMLVDEKSVPKGDNWSGATRPVSLTNVRD